MIPEAFPLDTFRKYAGLALPRHVSYPMPTAWSDREGADFVGQLARRAGDPDAPGISLYLHLPFCETLCKFCACNKVILKKEAKGAADKRNAYLEALLAEIDRVAELPGMNRPVRQIHWGGGSPTYLDTSEIAEIQGRIASRFSIAPDAEIAMEIDPRHTTEDVLATLARLGFTRVSMGIQDFDSAVQQHVHRIQPYEMVRDVVAGARRHGFRWVNFDLIYGMPYQTSETVADMVRKTIEIRPDRIAFYHYAQIPEKIATQRGMDYTHLPGSEEKLSMFLEAIGTFEAAGYDFIGLDHFALPEEPLARSFRDGTIQRNFQGMTTHGGLDLIGLGVSSITHLIGVGFWQKVKEIEAYEEGISRGELPYDRGIHFSEDDLIRQAVISDLYCFTRFDPEDIGRRFGILGREYFARELADLAELEADGLVEFRPDGVVEVTAPLGRVLLRNIAAVFDAYLDPGAYKLGDRYYYSVSA
ncbi:MAG: oxygen-independent coproporphyrinogen III oxidase [Candidatus Omnitrophica bacterium]|nr:Oxygen-independent coproporphyrinogen III oxidase [bacterium]NUN96639.1 oxygen-independent coproporphyrinogen III oxidase [Candidatus Omnitrophota bacterium]